MQLLPNPIHPWHGISMDFITDLLLIHGYTSIPLVVDLFTKRIHFIPCKDLLLPQKQLNPFWTMSKKTTGMVFRFHYSSKFVHTVILLQLPYKILIPHISFTVQCLFCKSQQKQFCFHRDTLTSSQCIIEVSFPLSISISCKNIKK